MSEEPKLPPETDAEKRPQTAEPAFDAASQSLTNALRMSFRVLTFVMLVLVVLFISRGFFTVQSDQKVIIERFGRADRALVKDQGIHYALPYPIDKVIPVWVRTKTMDVNVFWPKVSAETKENAASKGAPNQEYVPGADNGVVLTGDMNLMQGRLQVTYSIRGGTDASPDDIVSYYQNVGDEANEERLIKGLVQNAVIVKFSHKAVNDVYPHGTVALGEDVQSCVQEMIRKLDLGLEVQRVTFITIRPPENVKSAFDSVLGAHQGAETAMKEAERSANKMLIDAAGEAGLKLGQAIEARWTAYGKSDAAGVRTAEEQISKLLADAKGEVASITAEAKTYRTTVVSEASADSASIAKLVAGDTAADAASLKVFLEEMRIEAVQDVLSNCYEKFIYNPNQQERSTLEIWLNRRTEIRRQETIVPEQR